MIFATIGGTRAFERLVREVDRIAAELDEKVVIQIGPTDYEPRNCKYFRFVQKEEMDNWYSDARVIISHAGIGTILAAFEHNKPLILMPRMKRYGEHIDDHQLEIARELEGRGVAVVYDISKLESAIKNVGTSPVEFKREGDLVHRLKEYLDQREK